MKGEAVERDLELMREALSLAREAEQQGEVPVGAIVAKSGQVIGRGGTRQIVYSDPSAHAEVVAIREAALTIGNHRLVDTTLYVTMEPCMMCTGLMVQARISRLVFGCLAPKTGVIRSNGELLEWPSHNHTLHVDFGLLEEECRQLIQRFFKEKRKRD